MSQNTVRKYVLSLEDKALILTEPTTVYTKSGEKRNDSLLYTISSHSGGAGFVLCPADGAGG